jgi:hypothetical protein
LYRWLLGLVGDEALGRRVRSTLGNLEPAGHALSQMRCKADAPGLTSLAAN